MFEYQLKTSNRRRSVAIKVTKSGVVVHAPVGIALPQLQNWLEGKQSWVAFQQRKLQRLPQEQVPWETSTVRIYGKLYRCLFGEKLHSQIQHEEKLVYVNVAEPGDSSACRVALLEVLRLELQSYIMNALPEYELQMQVAVNKVKFREYKSRWGSCSSQRELTFNTLLVGAVKAHIDYVIVHELAHCHILAHNNYFWQIVARQLPDYKSAVNWFKTEGQSLLIKKLK